MPPSASTTAVAVPTVIEPAIACKDAMTTTSAVAAACTSASAG
jgi:hypothetical protein